MGFFAPPHPPPPQIISVQKFMDFFFLFLAVGARTFHWPLRFSLDERTLSLHF